MITCLLRVEVKDRLQSWENHTEYPIGHHHEEVGDSEHSGEYRWFVQTLLKLGLVSFHGYTKIC